jgi:hypothetical protein
MLEKEDERATAERLETQRKELEVTVVDDDSCDDGPALGGSAGASGVVPARGPGRRRADGGRATAEELSRARLEGWGGGPVREGGDDGEIQEEMQEENAVENEGGHEAVGVETDPERDARLVEFGRVMRERFLSGEDAAHVDYAAMDADESLDDTWRKEAAQDAEDAYFDAPSPSPSEE